MTQDETNTEARWLEAAYQMLTESGVDAVKILPLAKRVGLARTGFYWHFKDRDALLDAMIRRWEDKNTGNLIARTEAYAESIAEAMFNLFDCWLDNALFDGPLDLAIRNWARNDPSLQTRLDQADQRRLKAMTQIFTRFDYPDAEAKVRAMTMLYTQIGYLSMQIDESMNTRFALMPDYIKVFTGTTPTDREFDRFMARHTP
ncbi:MAG: TetR/AcrR family transcriptional regulator [Pelagimonas sp.]